MTSPPMPMPSAVPTGPAMGRKVVPGMTKEPQPTLQPKARAHAPQRRKRPHGVGDQRADEHADAQRAERDDDRIAEALRDQIEEAGFDKVGLKTESKPLNLKKK